MNGHFLRPTTSAKSIIWVSTIVLGEKNVAPSKVGQTENFQTCLMDYESLDVDNALYSNCPKEKPSHQLLLTRICKAKWAEPFNPPPPPPLLSLSLSLSLSLHKLEFLNWLGQDLLQRVVRFLKRCTSGSACS